jgi:flagellar export protein FliJ
MPKFTFRLASVLRMRCAQRDERRAELAQAFQAEEILRQQKHEIACELAELRRQRTTPGGELNVDVLLDAARYEFVLSAQQQALEEQTEKVSAEIERRRQALVAADQQVRTLEKLQETQQQRHHAAEQTREQSYLDEVAQQPTVRDAGIERV